MRPSKLIGKTRPRQSTFDGPINVVAPGSFYPGITQCADSWIEAADAPPPDRSAIRWNGAAKDDADDEGD